MSGFIQMVSIENPQKKRTAADGTPLPTIIAVDFDGTLCVNRWPQIGKARQPVIDWLLMQQKSGCKLILWTMRTDEKLAEAVAWCQEHGLFFDAVNDNLPEVQGKFGNNPRKVFANYYLDDHNL